MNSLKKWCAKLKADCIHFFDKDYIKKKTKNRKGKCLKCGECCGNCKHLKKVGKKKICSVYKNRPWKCHGHFPLSKKEQELWNVKKCGFCFDE